VPLAGLPLTSVGHRLFLPLNDPEDSMPNAVITLIAATAAVAVRCSLSLYAVAALCAGLHAFPDEPNL